MKVDEKNELVADVERVKGNEEQKQDNSKVLPEEIKSIVEIPKNDLKYHQQQDAFSGFVVLRPLPSKTAEEVVRQLLSFVGLFGIPNSILSDNGREFRNKLSDELVRTLGIKRLYTAPYHPATNGTVERVNRVVHNMMSIYLRQSHKSTHQQWPTILPYIEYSINTTVNRGSGFTPFQLLFGHQPNLPGFLEDQPMVEPSQHVRHITTEFRRFWSLASQQKLKLAHEMENAQRVIYESNFKTGDLVKVYSFVRPTENENSKWMAKWVGPFQVLKMISRSAVVVSDGIKNQTLNINRVRPYLKKSNEEMINFPVLPDYDGSDTQITDEEFEVLHTEKQIKDASFW